MKKLSLFIFLICFLFSGSAKAQFPVIDFGAIGQAISINLNIIDQTVKEVAKWKSIEATISVIGEVKAGLKKLSSWKDEIDEYIGLANMGISLINESSALASSAAANAQRAKELLEAPKQLMLQAKDLATNAGELLTSADDYAKQYQDTVREANAMMASTDPTIVEQARALHVKAVELDATSRRYLAQANDLTRQANDFIYQANSMYYEAQRINIESARNQDRACMLKIKGMQYKAELQRKFCENPIPGVNLDKGKYCDDQAEENNQDIGDQVDACAQKSQENLEKIQGGF